MGFPSQGGGSAFTNSAIKISTLLSVPENAGY